MSVTVFNYDEIHKFDSSCVELAAYDVESKNLYVRLHTGLERIYSPVEKETWHLFTLTETSAGGFWNNNFKHQYYMSYAVLTEEDFGTVDLKEKVASKPESWHVTPTDKHSYEITYQMTVGKGDTQIGVFPVTAANDIEAESKFLETIEAFTAVLQFKPVEVRRSLL